MFFQKQFFYLSFCLLSKTFWPLREISISFLLTILSASQILRSLEWRKRSPTKEALDFYTNSSCEHIIFFQRCLLKGYKFITDFLILLFFRVCGMRTHTKIRHSNTVLAWLDQNLLVLCRYLVNLKLAKSVQKNILVNEKISIFCNCILFVQNLKMLASHRFVFRILGS